MKTKSIVALLIIIAFTVGATGLAFATKNVAGKETADIRGTVTKIEDNKITVKVADKKETTVEVKKLPEGLKIGDRVVVKDGEVTRERPRRVIEGC